MRPILLNIGFLTIYSYGFMLALAFLAGLLLSLKLAESEGVTADVVLDIVIYVIISAIVGARVFYVIQFWSEFKGDLLQIFAIHHGGLVFYGGLLLALVVLFWRVRVHNISLIKAFDIGTPGTALGYSIARIGCFLNGCCYGIETDFPLAVQFPHLSGLRHPTQLYASGTIFLGFLLLLFLWKRRKFEGQLFLSGLLYYSTYRFFIEFIRVGPRYVLGLTISQLVSIVVFVVALYVLVKRVRTV